jgi:hypothetical protein
MESVNCVYVVLQEDPSVTSKCGCNSNNDFIGCFSSLEFAINATLLRMNPQNEMKTDLYRSILYRYHRYPADRSFSEYIILKVPMNQYFAWPSPTESNPDQITARSEVIAWK